MKAGSAIRYVTTRAINSTDPTNDSTTSGAKIMREGHLLVLSPLTTQHQEPPEPELLEFQAYINLAAFLAFQHIQHRNVGEVLPGEVQERIEQCDFQWTYRHHDTECSDLQAAKGLITQPTRAGPFAVLGSHQSVATETLSIVTSARDLPLISSTSSTSSSLAGAAPLFAQTMPSKEGDAHALMAYLHYQLHVPQVGVLFVQDPMGRKYQQALIYYANHYNMTLHSVPYSSNTEDDHHAALDYTMRQIQQLTPELPYWIGILDPNSWKPVVRRANKWGLMGYNNASSSTTTKNQWFLADIADLRGAMLTLDTETEWDIAYAVHGIGIPSWKIKPHPGFDDAMARIATDTKLQQAFIESHPPNQQHLFDSFSFNYSQSRYPTQRLQYLTYDAVMSLGLTACDTPGLFTGSEFNHKLREIDFEGVSGRVQLDNTTGTRRLTDTELLEYEIINVLSLMDGEGESTNSSMGMNSSFMLETRTSATIVLSPSINNNKTEPYILVNTPFVFADNTTNIPLPVQPIEQKMNLIPNGLRTFGLALAVYVMGLSLFCAYNTFGFRNKYVIRVAQPGFLISLCLGTFIMASTVILLSFQETMPQNTLDWGCGLIPWTLCIGYIIAMASLFSKTRRINKILQHMGSGKRSFRHSHNFRRVQVEPSDVTLPAFLLFYFNVGILLAWTWSPFRLTWQRTYVNNYDSLGRQIESYGACRPQDGTDWYLLFVIPLCCTNLLVLMRATYASYRGRCLPTEFRETKYLSVALVTLSETIIVGGLPLIAITNDPVSFFLLSTFVIVSACLAILLPVFLPKFWAIRADENLKRRQDDGLPHASNSNRRSGSFNSRRSGLFGSNRASRIAAFLASEPVAIRRRSNSDSDFSVYSNRTNATTATGSETASAVGTKGSATVSRAILLSQEASSITETTRRLDVLLEELKASRASTGDSC